MIILKRGSSLVILYFACEVACIDSYRSESKRNPFLYCTFDYSLSPCLQYCAKGMQTNFGETVANFRFSEVSAKFRRFSGCLLFTFRRKFALFGNKVSRKFAVENEISLELSFAQDTFTFAKDSS